MGERGGPAARRLRRIITVVPNLEKIPGVLGRIARRRFEVLARHSFENLPQAPAVPSFSSALTAPGLTLIAEVKRKSPSKGEIADLDAAATARAYVRGGAGAISVLTEPDFFGGSEADLRAVAGAVEVPVLRKDFVVHPGQIWEARALGASAVLLIVAVLGGLTGAYLEEARKAGIEALVEVHDRSELELAIAAGARIIGINNRDLMSLEVDINRAPELAREARAVGFSGLLVAESGYYHPEELASISRILDGVLVGSSLAVAGDTEAAVRRLLGR